MFCYKCGNQSPNEAEFCNKCGEKVFKGETQQKKTDTNIESENIPAFTAASENVLSEADYAQSSVQHSVEAKIEQDASAEISEKRI